LGGAGREFLSPARRGTTVRRIVAGGAGLTLIIGLRGLAWLG
jgi:hypothetical protein